MQTDSPPEQGTPQPMDRVLSSMCTEPHPAAREAAERFLATNPGDPDTYQSVAELEAAVVAKLGDVIGLSEPHGYVASGGTEANIQAVRAARNRSAESDPNIVAPESAHFSFEKAAEMLDVELRMAATGPNHRAAPDAMEALVDDSTALIVGVAGSTEHGRVDPIPELGRIAESADAQFHVDAAFGGFLLPFTDVAWDFSDAPVDTMTIDPHKVGQAAIPSGGFIAREEATLQALAIETPYLESDSQVSLGGTRSGAGVASAHAALEELWPDGYEANFQRTMSLARWFADQLAARDYQVADLTLPIVTWSMEEPLFEALREQGWRLARTGHGAVRVVVMPHVTEPILESFLADLDQIRE